MESLVDLLLCHYLASPGCKDFKFVASSISQHPLTRKFIDNAIDTRFLRERYELFKGRIKLDANSAKSGALPLSARNVCSEAYKRFRNVLLEAIEEKRSEYYRLQDRLNSRELEVVTETSQDTNTVAATDATDATDVTDAANDAKIDTADTKEGSDPESQIASLETDNHVQSKLSLDQNSKSRRSARHSSEPTRSKKISMQLLPALEILSQFKHGAIFSQPISQKDAPNYSNYVFTPQDFRTIKQQLKSGEITSPLEFYREVLRVFANAIMYNRQESAVAQWAYSCFLFAQETLKELIPLQGSSPPSDNKNHLKRKKD